MGMLARLNNRSSWLWCADSVDSKPPYRNSDEEPSKSWQLIDAKLRDLARLQSESDYEQGRWLLEALRKDVHAQLGFGSLSEYAERLFGYGPRMVGERLRVARSLESLPELSASLRGGQLCWSAVRELTRVATTDTERVWRQAADGKTVRQLEAMVSGLVEGQLPGERPSQALRRHKLSFEVSAETLATFRAAGTELRRRTGGRLDDDALLGLMAREVLAQGGQHGDAGRSSYQIAFTKCPSCEQGFQLGGGEPVAVAPEVIERAECDHQHLGEVPSDEGAHVGPERKERGKRTRANQNIPPAMRRELMIQYGGRCAVKGCHNQAFLDLHHLSYPPAGQRPEPGSVIVLCGVHHDFAHGGRLIIDRDERGKLRFFHADGRRYGASRAAVTSGEPSGSSSVRRTAEDALCTMGFGRAQVRSAVAGAHVGTEQNGDDDGEVLKQVIRDALGALTARRLGGGLRQ